MSYLQSDKDSACQFNVTNLVISYDCGYADTAQLLSGHFKFKMCKHFEEIPGTEQCEHFKMLRCTSMKAQVEALDILMTALEKYKRWFKLQQTHDKEEAQHLDAAILKFEPYRTAGQQVNEACRAMKVTHLPSGLSASSETHRLLAQNRAGAIRLLEQKVEAFIRRTQNEATNTCIDTNKNTSFSSRSPYNK